MGGRGRSVVTEKTPPAPRESDMVGWKNGPSKWNRPEIYENSANFEHEIHLVWFIRDAL